MLFWNDKPEKNGPKVEAKVRKEIGSTQPVPYETEVLGQYKAESFGQGLAEAAKELFGGKSRPLNTFRFNFATPHEGALVVSILKIGLSISLGPIIFSAPLSLKVSSAVNLEPGKLFSSAKFTGDPVWSEKLSGNKAFMKKIKEFVQSEYRVGNEIITVTSYCRLMPGPSGATFTVSTAPKTTWFGLGTSFRINQFFEIVGMLETMV